MASVASLCPARAFAQLFKPGNLVVTAYGNSGTASLDGQLTAITLIEFSTAGGPAVSTFVVPTADGVGGSANLGVVGEYGSSSEGNIQASANGQYLTFGAYGATGSANGIQTATNVANGTSFALGTAYSGSTIALGQSSDKDVPRVAAEIDINGNVNSSTVFNDLFNTNNPRSVFSSDGTSVYISGQGDGNTTNQGIFYAPVGLNTITSSGTPTGIYNSVDTRFVSANAGNLYFSVDKKSVITGIFEFAGLPTTSMTPARITAASNGLTGASGVNYSPEGFFFANATTLYVADTGQPKNKSGGVAGDGGVQKWVLSGGTWQLLYTFKNPSTFVSHSAGPQATSGETGFEAITGQVAGDSVQLFAVSYTAADDQPNGLYTISDTLDGASNPGTTLTQIESAPGSGGIVFKGVTFALVPPPIGEPAMPVWALILLAALLVWAATRFLSKRAAHPAG
ncbi:MAG TPA: hypothetical protein VII09_01055 [Opitutaceae bacterium]